MNIRQLFNPRIGSKEAVEMFFRRRSLVRMPNCCHCLVVSPTGGGKGVSIIVPHLLTCEDSCVVVDFKGELSTLTAKVRERMGHQIVVLDPYGQVTGIGGRRSDMFNPLEFIKDDDRMALDDVNDLANALVVKTGMEREPHWNASAEAVIAGITAAVVAYGCDDARSLLGVREIISKPAMLDAAVAAMLESDAFGGLLSQMGGQLMHFADKEKSSVLSTTLRHLRFLGTESVAENVTTSSFDPSMLRRGKMTAYLVLPAHRTGEQSAGLLRMWITSMVRACVREGLE